MWVRGQPTGPKVNGGPGLPEKPELYILMQNSPIFKLLQLSKKNTHSLDLGHKGGFASLV